MIKVLVVDDSAVAREVLSRILTSDPSINVVATAGNGQEAIKLRKLHKPDVVTMDLNMPVMDGLTATRHIMENDPLPIVVITGMDVQDVKTSFDAMHAGAISILPKPATARMGGLAGEAKIIIDTIKALKGVHPGKLEPRSAKELGNGKNKTSSDLKVLGRTLLVPEVIGIGASTGGPPVIARILSELPAGFPVPILVVQHIVSGFTQGLMEWLKRDSKLKVQLATHNQTILPGNVYLAPDNKQMIIEKRRRISLTDDPPEYGLRPSVSTLFRSLAENYGDRSWGILLTGMGTDGAAELRKMKDAGAITIAQDRASSTIYGMPGEAARLDAAKYKLSPYEMIHLLLRLDKK